MRPRRFRRGRIFWTRSFPWERGLPARGRTSRGVRGVRRGRPLGARASSPREKPHAEFAECAGGDLWERGLPARGRTSRAVRGVRRGRPLGAWASSSRENLTRSSRSAQRETSGSVGFQPAGEPHAEFAEAMGRSIRGVSVGIRAIRARSRAQRFTHSRSVFPRAPERAQRPPRTSRSPREFPRAPERAQRPPRAPEQRRRASSHPRV